MLTADVERTWARFAKKVDWPGSLDLCWIWTGARSNGYGRFNLGSHLPPAQQSVPAHRVAYEMLLGPIPEGLYIDHLCRTPPCVNPFHMEPVPHLENWARGMSQTAINRRKTHCLRGHLYDEANTRITVKGHLTERACRTCVRDGLRARRAALTAAGDAS